MSDKAHKSWRTRRARKAAKTRKINIIHKKLSAVARQEVERRKQIQKTVTANLKKWWRAESLEGSPSNAKPIECIICGESETLGLEIHHIDPRIKKGETDYDSMKNKAPICGTCHNIITHKKTGDAQKIIAVLKARHKSRRRFAPPRTFQTNTQKRKSGEKNFVGYMES